MSHATKLLQTLFLKHNYNLKKKNKHLSKIWSKSLSPVKDRDLKLQARGKCTSLSLDLLNKQLSTISINITVIISFCMVYKMFVQSKIQTRQTSTLPMMQKKKKINDVAMWQSQRYVFSFPTPHSLYIFSFFKTVSNQYYCHVSLRT